MNEDEAAKMISDCIDEQYKLDYIGNQFASIYEEAKNNVDRNLID